MTKYFWCLSAVLLSGCIGSNEPRNAVSDYPSNFTIIEAATSHKVHIGPYNTAVVTADNSLIAWGATSDNEHLNNIASVHGDLALTAQGDIIYLTANNALRDAISALNLPPLIDIEYSGDGKQGIALTPAGQILTWPEPPPAHSGYFVDIALVGDQRSYDHFVALDIDGSILTWGKNNHQQLNMPKGLGKVVKIDAGSEHTIALTETGRVAVWSNNQSLSFCYIGCPRVIGIGVYTLPDGLTNEYSAIDIAANGDRNAVLLSDGTVYVWGNSYLTHVFPSDGTQRESITIGSQEGVLVQAGDQLTRLENSGGDSLITPKRKNLWEVANQGGYWVDESGNSYWLNRYSRRFSENAFSEYQSTELVSIGPLSSGQYFFALANNGQLFAELAHRSTADGPHDIYLTVDNQIESATITQESIILANTTNELTVRALPWFHLPDSVPAWQAAIANTELSAKVNKLVYGTLAINAEQSSEIVLALLADGSIHFWGQDNTALEQLAPIFNEPIQDVRIFKTRVFVLTNSGQIIAWGGDAEATNQHLATLPQIAKFASGQALAITTNGELVHLESSIHLPDDLQPIIDATTCEDQWWPGDSRQCTVVIQQDGTTRAWGSQLLTPKYYELQIQDAFQVDIQP